MSIINVSISSVQKNGQSFENRLIEHAKIVSEKNTKKLAEETVKVIREKIKDGIKRANSTSNLANSFTLVKISGGWGVGDIAYLNKHAPYWRHINYGSFAIGANWRHKVPVGMFSPGEAAPNQSLAGEGNQGTDRWYARMAVGGKSFDFIPTKEIKAHSYIEATLVEMMNRLTGIIRL